MSQAPAPSAPEFGPDVLRRAMAAAGVHGMVFRQRTDAPEQAVIACKTCGWPAVPEPRFVITKYAQEPWGCVFCAAGARP